MFKKILVANRGEIAVRIFRTARRMGIATVAVHSEADRNAPHVEAADEAVLIGPAPAAQSYLVMDRIVEACRATGADAVHPGYGFLSERAAFAERLAAEGIAFIGPNPHAIAAMGDKIESKRLAAAAGVNVVPGFLGVIESDEQLIRIAREIGYPVMLKASAGGGGKGMRVAHSDAEAIEGFARARSEAAASFGDDRVFVEKFIEDPRHIEIQLIGDKHGNVIHLGERECSVQRRNQKVVEEAPSPLLDPATRAAMGAQAVALAEAVGYDSAGTVEFVASQGREFFFLEMNTRLQVEHPVTELVTGLDLVELMIRSAAGEPLPLGQEDVRMDGWAVESRVYAEDPYRNFLPSIGRLTTYREPPQASAPGVTVRNDAGVAEGSEISMFYDPMISKLCTHAPSRIEAIDAMQEALDAFEIEGIQHNIPFLSALMANERWRRGALSTRFIEEEFPGFHGVEPDAGTLARIAAVGAAMQQLRHRRDIQISGRLDGAPDGLGRWAVDAGGTAWIFDVVADGGTFLVGEDGSPPRRVASDWRPGLSLCRADVDGVALILKVEARPSGFRVRYRGAELNVLVRTGRAAELARLMPVKAPPDTSNLLLCPMPGLLVSLLVAEGEEVQTGQPLAVVEAMKMENILRAERHSTVKTIRAKPGASLAVDEVILEFG
jgi:propionyl-CoA carboxylase alpha chain